MGNLSHVGASAYGGSLRTGVSAVSWNTSLTLPVLNDTHSISNVTVSSPQSDIDIGMLYPDFLRRRGIPDRHMAVPREVHHGLLMESVNQRMGIDASNGDLSALLKMKKQET